MARQPSKQDIEQAQTIAGDLDKVAAHRPSLDDYVSEGVLPYKPEGKFSFPVNGKRVLQMNEEANRMAAWCADNRSEASSRRANRAAIAERTARRSFSPPIKSMVGYGLSGWQYRCTRGHTFAFLRSKPDAECRKCIRDGCEAYAYRERA